MVRTLVMCKHICPRSSVCCRQMVVFMQLVGAFPTAPMAQLIWGDEMNCTESLICRQAQSLQQTADHYGEGDISKTCSKSVSMAWSQAYSAYLSQINPTSPQLLTKAASIGPGTCTVVPIQPCQQVDAQQPLQVTCKEAVELSSLPVIKQQGTSTQRSSELSRSVQRLCCHTNPAYPMHTIRTVEQAQAH